MTNDIPVCRRRNEKRVFPRPLRAKPLGSGDDLPVTGGRGDTSSPLAPAPPSALDLEVAAGLAPRLPVKTPGPKPTSLAGEKAGVEDPQVLKEPAVEPSKATPPTDWIPGGAADAPPPASPATAGQVAEQGDGATTQGVPLDLMERRLGTLILDYETAEESHIAVKDPGVCREECQRHPCVEFCPAHVFGWHDETGLGIQYQKCVECAACAVGCPERNLVFHYPTGGCGVTFRYG